MSLKASFPVVREFTAILAARLLWRLAREPRTTAVPFPFYSRDRNLRERHYHRWFGDRNGLAEGWRFTFNESMPLKPTQSIDYDGRTLEIYLDTKRGSLVDVLGSIRLVTLSKGNQCAIRSLDLSRLCAATGADTMIENIEELLAAVGIILDRIGPAPPCEDTHDAFSRVGKKRG